MYIIKITVLYSHPNLIKLKTYKNIYNLCMYMLMSVYVGDENMIWITVKVYS